MAPVILKKGRERSLKRRHPWIFSGAIEKAPAYSPGDILPIHSSTGEFLGTGYFHPDVALSGRVLTFDSAGVEEALKKRIREAVDLRRVLFRDKQTTAYRLINAEGDGLPGLVVDHYNGHLVLQSSTCGVEKLKPLILELLTKEFSPQSIYEKSTSSSRREEGLEECEKELYGQTPDEILVQENGISFLVSPRSGQKTGFFLDQREMRQKIKKLAGERVVLNAFGYTGGFSIYALLGGAKQATTLDSSGKALALAEKNCLLNNLSTSTHKTVEADVFDFLEKETPFDYDLVILDPPAFAKKRKDVNGAVRRYKELNARALKKMAPRSLLLTCSCSYHVEEILFRQMLFQAALEAQREVRVIGEHIQAADHPVSLYHPEGRYLKSLLLFVE